MWQIARYEASALFSLKPSTATSSGGRTLLAPSPYAIKMALIDAACRTLGVSAGEVLWPSIRDAGIALQPAHSVVVSNTFQRIIKPARTDIKKSNESEESGPQDVFQRTIGYREYAQMAGEFCLALKTDDEQAIVASLFGHISYLGKRGGFVQWLGMPPAQAELDQSFVLLTEAQNQFSAVGVIQAMDDCGQSLTFDKANVYSDKRITLGKDRIHRNIVLPYRLMRSTRAYSVYELA